MKRRDFLGTSALVGAGSLMQRGQAEESAKTVETARGSFSLTGYRAAVYSPAVAEPFRLFQITDSHLALDDARGEAWRDNSKRMAAAFQNNVHFEDGKTYPNPEIFEMTLARAQQEKADFIALTGDIFSFPSEAAVEFALDKLNAAGIPFGYVAGNHDWHYEGLPGSSKELRDTWTARRLAPLYQGVHPLYHSQEHKGIRFVFIDNSIYEILPEQLDFFRSEAATGNPLVLLMHIPLYIPGRGVGFGCGHPQWGAATDHIWELERREIWRKEGHTETTFAFHKEVFSTPNLLLVLAGHIHQASLDVKQDIPQIVTAHNACGHFGVVDFKALP
ncbi:MAG TPA: metallophosphoesterase [Candidatus Hydrogenedentes bacterium]|nr:metallophosphoesterase [Candidatus Hydrogenedentota bacterium]HPX86936.1 metallophosphoesterase [Candidatus Hydrogenedentota bacterium]